MTRAFITFLTTTLLVLALPLSAESLESKAQRVRDVTQAELGLSIAALGQLTLVRPGRYMSPSVAEKAAWWEPLKELEAAGLVRLYPVTRLPDGTPVPGGLVDPTLTAAGVEVLNGLRPKAE